MASNFEFTDKAQESLAAAIQLAKDGHNPQVHPVHLAAALINETPAGKQANGASTTSLFRGIVDKAGADPAVLNRGFQKLLVRLSTQEPPPDDIQLGPPMIKVLREAQSIQKTMVCF